MRAASQSPGDHWWGGDGGEWQPAAVRPMKPAELEFCVSTSDACTHCSFHAARLRQKHTYLLKEKEQMYSRTLRVLGTNPDRQRAAGFVQTAPDAVLPGAGSHLPPPPAVAGWGLFSPLLGPFGLIPGLSLAPRSPVSWTFFFRLPLAMEGSLVLPVAAPGPGGLGQSRGCRSRALESRRFGFESPHPFPLSNPGLLISNSVNKMPVPGGG